MKKKTKPNNVVRQNEFEMYIEQQRLINEQFATIAKTIYDKLDAINNVQVNGRVGLQESLQDIYLLTKELRNKQNLFKAFNEWKKDSILGKIYATRIGKILFWIGITFIGFSILQTVHVINVDIIKAIAAIINATI